MKLVSRLQDAWHVLRGKKSVYEIGQALSMLIGRGDDAVFGWQFKASKLLAEEVGAAAFKVYRVKGDGSWSPLEAHPLLDLLHRPNQIMTRSELFEAVSMSLDFFGNAYLFLDGGDTPNSKPKALHLLNASRVSIVRTDSFPETIAAYKYRERSKEYVFKPHQVLHIRESNPVDILKGLGPVQALSDAIETDRSAREWNRNFFGNSARPDLILKTKFKTREQMDPLRAQFEDRYRGTENAHKVAMLPDGVEPDKMGWSQKDMDFVEQMHWSRDDILSGLRTPHVVLGLGAGENLNRATADTTNYIYALRTVTPRLRRIAASLNAFIVPRFGKDIVFDFDNVVPDDEDLQIRKRIAALGGAPYQSVNEIREDIGLPKVPGGERVMTTYSQIPLGSTPEEPEPKRLASSGAYFALQFVKKNEDVSESVGKSVDSIVEKAAKTLESVEKVLKRSREEGSWRGFVARVTPYEDLLRKRFARYGRDVAARAESNLSEASKGIDYDELLNEEEEVRSIMRFVHPALEDLYRREGVAVADEISGAFEATEARIRETVGRAVNLLAKSYHEETVRLLREALEEGIVEGEGIDKLKHRIRDVGEFSSDVRALRVARTETFRIANLAGKEAYRQSGFTKLVWFTASDEAVCEFCGPMDGKVVSIEENFFNKGESVRGADGGVLDLNYSDVEAGALHPNCRCRVVGRRADEN